MSVMLNTESVVTLDQAVARLPAGLRRNRSTIWRWCRVGVRGVKLKHGFAGRTIVTTMEAFDFFFRAIADATPLPSAPTAPVPRGATSLPRQAGARGSQSSIDTAEAYLAELGI